MSKIWIDNYANDDGGFTKQRRYSVETGNQSDYQKFLSSSTSEYPYRAGCDLSVLFMPYETDYTTNGQRLPRFEALTQADAGYGDDEIGVEELHIWELNHAADAIYETTNQIELDSISDIVSGPDYRGSTANIRSTKSIRGVGLRLPMIGVGWGYDINGNPVPSGLNGSGFLNPDRESEFDLEHGWQVDPKDYVAAPIDMRYDSVRKVWGGPPGGAVTDKFLAIITGSTLQASHAARWTYEFQEVELTSATGYQVVEAGVSGTAINIDEFSHTTEPGATTVWYVWGVQSHSSVTGSAYPAGARPRPPGGGGTSGTHKTNFIVEMTARTTSTNETVYTFSRQGSHDGTCT